MNIVVVSCSTRPGSQSRKVADIIMHKLSKKSQIETSLVDLYEAQLPVYDDTNRPEWKDIKHAFTAADGLVWVIPEWNGTAGPGVMNLLGYIKRELFHKPVLPVSVSNGIGGAYPLAQVKGFGAKNSRVVFVPEPIRIMGVEEIFNSPEPNPDVKNDAMLHERTEYALDVLLAYAAKLGELRDSGVVDSKRYTSGY